MENIRKKGIALIVVIVIIILFSSLILAVVLSATISYRRAHYYKDKDIALEIAEAGIQDCLYWMNYKGYDTQYYPENNYYFKGSDYTGSDTWTGSEVTFQPIKNLTGKYWCKLYFEDSNETDMDRIVSIGYYNGRTAKISVRIRGNNTPGTRLNDEINYETQGIPEAFNKHVIYAGNIGLPPSGNPTTVKGNITTISSKPNSWPSNWQEATWTETSSVPIPVLSVNSSIPPFPSTSTYLDTYNASGIRTTSSGDVDVNTVNDGVWFDDNNKIYYFGTDNGSTPSDYTRTDSSVEISGANAVLKFGVRIGNYFNCLDNTVTVESAIFQNPGQTLIEANTINLPDNAQIDGFLLVKPNNSLTIGNNITINGDFGIDLSSLGSTTISSSNLTINGSLFSNGSITISGSITIDSTNSNKKAAILLYKDTDATLNLNIQSGTNLTLKTGKNQVAGIMVYFDIPPPPPPPGTNKISNITISAPLSNDSGEDTKFLIVNHSETGQITISNNVNGSIYSAYYYEYSSPPPPYSITINSGTINGSIITNGQVNLNGGSIEYNPEPYKKESRVYVGFRGGRRRYLPVPGSWRIEW